MYFLLALIIWPLCTACVLVEMWLILAALVLWVLIPPWRPALGRFITSLQLLVQKASRIMGSCWL